MQTMDSSSSGALTRGQEVSSYTPPTSAQRTSAAWPGVVKASSQLGQGMLRSGEYNSASANLPRGPAGEDLRENHLQVPRHKLCWAATASLVLSRTQPLLALPPSRITKPLCVPIGARSAQSVAQRTRRRSKFQNSSALVYIQSQRN